MHSQRNVTAFILAGLLASGSAFSANRAAGAEDRSVPNVVLFFTDDQGYGDVGCFGAKGLQTPHLDRLAKEGMRFTDFYVAQAVCTASRAALMTGCYANRVSMQGALNPTSTAGIHPDEVLLPELFKSKGYATAIYGKWHLGNQAKFHPYRNGFDDYFGLPFSNDNSNQYHPVIRNFPPLPLYDGEKVIAQDPDQSQFTQQITARAVKFIDRNQDKPFFLYVPHIMPHVPIFASEKFKGKSPLGLYGDVIQEVDWSMGQILAALQKHGLEKNTLVIFASDNGPFLSYGEHAGSAGPLRGGKLTTFEGGVRVPCILRWPGHIPAGSVCREPAMTIDLLPTIAKLIGADLPKHPIDGKDIWQLMTKPGAKSPHPALVFYAGGELQSLRMGDWKLHFPHPYLEVAGAPGKAGKPSNFENLKPESITKSGIDGIASRHGYRVEQIGLSLFDLKDDLGEKKNVADQHPDIVKQMQQLAEPIREQLGDSLQKRTGKAVRPAGQG